MSAACHACGWNLPFDGDWKDYFVPCCGGWHVSHRRARVGSYYDWLLSRLMELGVSDCG